MDCKSRDWSFGRLPKSGAYVKNTYGFPEDKIQAFKDAFAVFDKNGDGEISTDELKSVLMDLGYRPTVNEIKTLIRTVDRDGSNSIDFDEFLLMMSKRETSDQERELRAVFDVFDGNKDGFITNDELYDVLQGLGEKITKGEIADMIKEADLDGDGKVSYTEFKNILKSKS